MPVSGTFVTIADIVVLVIGDSGYIEEPELQGDLKRGDDGGFQNMLRTPKQGFAFVGLFKPGSTFFALRTAISAAGEPGVPVPVTVTSPPDGLTGGQTLTCLVRLGRGQFKITGAGGNKTTKITAPVTVWEA